MSDTEDEELLDGLARYADDPVGFALWAFPWGEPGSVLEFRQLEPWQLELLNSVKTGLKTPEAAIREAAVSGNGVGKSALVSIMILWMTTTAPDTKGVVTANTETQLKTKTWAELGKWFNLFIAKRFFKLTATALLSCDKSRERTWRCDMVPWSEHNIVAFQGLHNEGRRLFVIMDEASGIPDLIHEAADGCMTDANTERLWFMFGNPNSPKGRFRDAFDDGKHSSRWSTRRVDARTVSFTDKEELNEWIRIEGIDSDFVRIRVLGLFPKQGFSAFISETEVALAVAREINATSRDPLVMGVDVARFGDDETVVWFRRGRDARSIPPVSMRGAATTAVSARVAELAQQHNPDAIFVDGGGVGGGVVDQLRQLRVACFDIQFGSKPNRTQLDGDATRYANKRAEMWGFMRSAIRTGVALPDDRELRDQLVGPLFGYNNNDEIQLERKKDMRRRGVPSPDRADALALTYAMAVMPKELHGAVKSTLLSDYDPFKEAA